MNIDVPGTRVLHGVLQGLLDDAIQGLLDLERRGRLAVGNGARLDEVSGSKHLDLSLERQNQPFRFERFRPQLEDQRAHLSLSRLSKLQGVVDLLDGSDM